MKRRKTIPWRVKCEVALHKLGLTIREVQFDHIPALALREWDAEANDTIPPANSVEHIQLLMIAEHKAKTTGRTGESRFSGNGRGDAQEIAKARRKILAPTERPKPKRKWPSRPLRRRLP